MSGGVDASRPCQLQDTGDCTALTSAKAGWGLELNRETKRISLACSCVGNSQFKKFERLTACPGTPSHWHKTVRHWVDLESRHRRPSTAPEKTTIHVFMLPPAHPQICIGDPHICVHLKIMPVGFSHAQVYWHATATNYLVGSTIMSVAAASIWLCVLCC